MIYQNFEVTTAKLLIALAVESQFNTSPNSTCRENMEQVQVGTLSALDRANVKGNSREKIHRLRMLGLGVLVDTIRALFVGEEGVKSKRRT